MDEPRAHTASPPDRALRVRRLALDDALGLLAVSPREILAHLVHGDPLEVRAVVARRLAEQRLLIDVERATVRAFARAAHALAGRAFARAAHALAGDTSRGEGRRAACAIVEASVDDALEDLREADDAPPRIRDAFESLATALELSPEALRAGCARFNRLDLSDREAFFRLVVEGTPLDDLAREGTRSATDWARAARRALTSLL